jgi:hypothetical protein
VLNTRQSSLALSIASLSLLVSVSQVFFEPEDARRVAAEAGARYGPDWLGLLLAACGVIFAGFVVFELLKWTLLAPHPLIQTGVGVMLALVVVFIVSVLSMSPEAKPAEFDPIPALLLVDNDPRILIFDLIGVIGLLCLCGARVRHRRTELWGEPGY